jgi:RES domain-containing protein
VILYRLASRAFPIFDGTGAALNGARWNSKGMAVIYTVASLAGAKLELLAHIGFKARPKNFGFVKIEVPDGVKLSRFPRATVPSPAQ